MRLQTVPDVAGFTLLEVITVLILLGMLALSGTSFVRQTSVSVYIERDALVSRLLYARGQGMVRGGGVCLRFRNEKGRVVQRLTREQGAIESIALTFPGEPAQHVMPENINVNVEMDSFCFDAFGRLCTSEALRFDLSDGIQLCAASTAAHSSRIVLSTNESSQTLTLFNETGLIQ